MTEATDLAIKARELGQAFLQKTKPTAVRRVEAEGPDPDDGTGLGNDDDWDPSSEELMEGIRAIMTGGRGRGRGGRTFARPGYSANAASLLDVWRGQAFRAGLPVSPSKLARLAEEGCHGSRAGSAPNRAPGRARVAGAVGAAGCLRTASACDCVPADRAATSAATICPSTGTVCRQGSCGDRRANAGRATAQQRRPRSARKPGAGRG